jgi:hypothetical protein
MRLVHLGGCVPGYSVTECANSDTIPASKPEVLAMSCRSCGSAGSADFSSEIMIHFVGRKNVDKPGVLLFLQVTVCLYCGFTEFILPEAELRLLVEGGKSTAA